MPPKPNYYHELNTAVRLLEQQAAYLREESERVKRILESIAQEQDALKQLIGALREELAVVKHQRSEQARRIDEWDRRWWGLIVILIGALLSLAAGLLLTFVRR